MSKQITPEMKAYLASDGPTLRRLWLLKRISGIYGAFTNYDRDIPFSLAAARILVGLTPAQWTVTADVQTYLRAGGYTASDVASSSDMSVPNMEVDTFDATPSITEADLAAGLYDFARVAIFDVNPNDLTMGCLSVFDGWLGKVTLGRGTAKAGLRGLLDAYQVTMLEQDTPVCRADLFDERCKVDPAGRTVGSPSYAFTVTGTLTGVGDDGFTLFDSSRTEPGPPAGVAVTGVSNANPGIVNMAGPGTFKNGDRVILSGVVGPAVLNRIWTISGLSANSWSLGIDTSDTGLYPAYVSGGTVSLLNGTGFFTGGKLTMTSGANTGLSMEIKAYVPTQFSLQLPFPYDCEINDAYTATAGCNKLRPTCRDTFNNMVNSRAEWDLAGQDSMAQVGGN